MKFKGSFGDWLKQRRKALDLTQQELADQVGCAEVTIRKIEGDVFRPSKQIAERMADVLAIAAEERAAFMTFARRRADKPPSLPVESNSETASRLPAHNLPPQSTPFVGRTLELAQIAERLADPNCRLLTLVGPGGVGKTRLALQAAQREIGNFADGVYFVPLASVGASDQIAPAIITALNLSFYSAEDPNSQILNYLHDKHMFLVLDNLEHLLDGIGLPTAILENATQVKLLTTSRERLNVKEEWVLPTEGLPVPEGKHTDSLVDFGAVELLLQCARRIQPGFSLTDNESAVVSICQAVEGMPLGIELAASWLRVLSCDLIAQQIGRSLDFLATPLRNVAERHRSMRVMLDHSWKLLSDTEQRVLSRLSVFRGGFDLQAAEQVTGATLSVLASLADKSMIRINHAGRYDLHELLRQYGADRLKQSGESAQMAHCHMEYFSRLAQRSDLHHYGPHQQARFDQLEVEHDNLRAALAWTLDTAQVEAGVCLAEALVFFWENRGHSYEAYDWWEKLLALTHDAPGLVRATALRWTGGFAVYLGQQMRARLALEESLVLARAVGDKSGIAWSLGELGFGVEAADHNLNWAVVLLEEGLALFRELGDRLGISHLLRRLGWAVMALGDYGRATALLEEALTLARQMDDKGATAWSLLLLGNVAWYQRHDADQAIAFYRACLALSSEIQDKANRAMVLFMLGQVARSQEDYESSRTYYEESLTLFHIVGADNVYNSYTLAAFGGLLRMQGYFESAARLFGASAACLEGSVGATFPFGKPADLDADTAAVCSGLGEAAFNIAWAEGRAMTIKGAVVYALECC